MLDDDVLALKARNVGEAMADFLELNAEVDRARVAAGGYPGRHMLERKEYAAQRLGAALREFVEALNA